MSYTSPESGSFGQSASDRPYAFDPISQPEYFEGVLSRRLMAFCIDATIIIAPIVMLAFFIFVFGIITLSLGWMLFPVLGPAFVIWAIWYNAVTLGSPASATLGMRAMGLEMRTWYGAPMYSLLGAVHAVAYWLSMSIFTPFIVLVALFNGRRRMLHDFAVGTVLVNNETRASDLRRQHF